MSHDLSIPQELHVGARPMVKDALGSFWSSVFSDQTLVDGLLAARVLSACQAHIDAMEALSLRNHNASPVFHREHWHPMLIRLSQRNKARGFSLGMQDTPVIGPQPEDPEKTVYLPGEVFEIGGNAEYSRVNTYPFVAMDGAKLVRVKTCITDAISAPKHILTQDSDFAVEDGVLVIRKEQDPFDVDGYRIVEDEDDKIAVLWCCDAEFDTNNVTDFLGYPMGIAVPSTEKASRMLSALWDAVVFGVTPRYLNAALGAVFDVPTVISDTVVEDVILDTIEEQEVDIQETSHDTVPSTEPVAPTRYATVVTTDTTYRVVYSKLLPSIVKGATLRAGDFLTDDITVYSSLSKDEVHELATKGTLSGLSLLPGNVTGVSSTVVIENRTSTLEDGGWFKLNSGDTAASDFWKAVFAHTTEEERTALFVRLSQDGSTVNPLIDLGYTILANTVLIISKVGLADDPCAPLVFDLLSSLIPSYASLTVVQTVSAEDSVDLAAVSDEVESLVTDTQAIEDEGEQSGFSVTDSVAVTFFPVAATEV